MAFSGVARGLQSVGLLFRTSVLSQPSHIATYATSSVAVSAVASFPRLYEDKLVVPIKNLWTGEDVGQKELSPEIFLQPVRKDILHRVVTWQLAGRRQGSHKAKGRGEVAYSGKKLRPQKGSGNARCGSRRAPNFVGGGAVFGPVVRSHEQKLQRKVRQLGMKIALSAKLAAGELTIVENLDMENPSTKVAAKAIASLVPAKNCVIVDGQELNEKFDKATTRKILIQSLGNLFYVDLFSSQGANVYDILRRHHLVLTQEAVDNLSERLHKVL